jgi:hypothetical protein
LAVLIGLAILLGFIIACGRVDSDNRAEPFSSPQALAVSPGRRSAAEEEGSQANLPARRTSVGRQVDSGISSLPLRFIANVGQTDRPVAFAVQGAGHTIFFTPEEVVFSAAQEMEGETVRCAVRVRFIGADPNPTLEGLEPLPGAVNYFLGDDPTKWRTDVPAFKAIAYRDLYPGIDLVFRGIEGHLKSEFQLASGADPAAVEIAYSGVEAMHLREDGALVLTTPLGELAEAAPLIFQEVDRARQIIPGGYVFLYPPDTATEASPLETQDPAAQTLTVGFRVTSYDPSRPLIIDPELIYSSHLGGSNDADYGWGIAADSAGSIYLTGIARSSDFPTTANALQPAHGGGTSDAFVTQLIRVGGVYTYGFSTYLGGSGNDRGNGITVDDAGNVYVAGSTQSADFPTWSAIQTTHANTATYDVFVTKIVSASGAYTLAYSTYLGGSDYDWGLSIALDSADNVYVTGSTASSDFPTTTNAIQTSYAGGVDDAFVTKIIRAGTAYTYGYSTFVGGSDWDQGNGIAVDDDDNVYLAGVTYSSDFPTTTNAAQPVFGGGTRDAFLTQIISAGTVYTYGYSTYVGGSNWDSGWGVALEHDGTPYIVGSTNSSDFPTTTNAVQPAYGGGTYDAFVAQIISAGTVYTYSFSTYLGGSDSDQGYGIAVGSDSSVYVTGDTTSSDFPTTTNAVQPAHGGGAYDAFVAQIIRTGMVYTYGYSTYLGGEGGDEGDAIAADGGDSAYVTGVTVSTNFPTTADAINSTYMGGGWDVFVTVIGDVHPAYLPLVLRDS